MTKGEYRVGINFNPSADSSVDRLKRAAANFIDQIDAIGMEGLSPGAVDPFAERRRLVALAMTAAEEAAMWAVKAATKPELKDE